MFDVKVQDPFMNRPSSVPANWLPSGDNVATIRTSAASSVYDVLSALGIAQYYADAAREQAVAKVHQLAKRARARMLLANTEEGWNDVYLHNPGKVSIGQHTCLFGPVTVQYPATRHPSYHSLVSDVVAGFTDAVESEHKSFRKVLVAQFDSRVKAFLRGRRTFSKAQRLFTEVPVQVYAGKFA